MTVDNPAAALLPSPASFALPLSQGIELFVAGVQHQATETDVQEAFANVLHSYPVASSSVPVNFSVYVFNSRNKQNHQTWNAFIMVADEEVGKRLLAYYARIQQLESNPYESGSARRLYVIDAQHAKVAHHAGRHVLLNFPPEHEAEQFKHRRSEHVSVAEDLRRFKAEVKKLDIRIAFQLELLLHNSILTLAQLLPLLPTASSLEARFGADQAERILCRFANKLSSPTRESWTAGNGHGDPWWEQKEEGDYLSSTARPFDKVGEPTRTVGAAVKSEKRAEELEHVAKTTGRLPARGLDDTTRLHYGRHVILTPSGMRLEGPLIGESNGILRNFPSHTHHFLRVSLREEDIMKPIFGSEELDICGSKWRFLGSRKVLLKSTGHGSPPRLSMRVRRLRRSLFGTEWGISRKVHFFSSFSPSCLPPLPFPSPIITVPYTVIKSPARYMTRLAQAMTATKPTLILSADQIVRIPNSYSAGGSCFTDGVGKISIDLAKEVDQILTAGRLGGRRKNRVKASCYQVRIGGIKGMLAIDPLLKGKVVAIHPSMEKFDGQLALDIADIFDRPLPCYLNRPLICVLEGLGISPSVFLDLQKNAAEAIRCSRDSLKDAATMIERQGFGTVSMLSSILLRLSRLLGSDLPASEVDPFLNACVDVVVADALRSLKFRARIPVKGWTLVGVCDEDKYLKEGEIYACIHQKGKSPVYLEGQICISRSPTAHPGDVQVVRAVGRLPPQCCTSAREFDELRCFLRQGFVLSSSSFASSTFQRRIPAANSRRASCLPSPNIVWLPRPATIDDGVDFFLSYILNDLLGMVANRSLHVADAHSPYHKDFLKLTELHFQAVDYPKAGQPVALASLPKAPSRLKPGFMVSEYWAHEKGHDKLFYTSDKALGRLFCQIPLQDTRPQPWNAGEDALDPSRVVTSTLRSLRIPSFRLSRLPSSPSYSLLSEMRNLLADWVPEIFYIASSNSLSKRTDRHLGRWKSFSIFERIEASIAVWTGDDDEEEDEPEEQILRGWAC
ncbi:hypothetical protein JCM8547_002944 [Rhodosporidiobolus lusitaniae]